MVGKRVAIVGSGCSGLGALWALKDTDHEVHLFEADETLGGHTNTVKFRYEDKDVNVDTGFIIFNTATYPNFIKFLKAINLAAVPTDMGFGVSRDKGSFEWSGSSLSSVFSQWINFFSPRMWRMIFDIIRFNQFALDVLSRDIDINPPSNNVNGAAKMPFRTKAQQSIGEYIAEQGYSDAFRDDYLIPMTAAVWSTSPDKCTLQFPATTLIRFLWNHHLLNTIAARPSWMTIPGGSQQYIDAIIADFPRDRIHLSTPVTSVEDINSKIILQFENNDEDLFDHVILACHGDQAFNIISDSGTYDERAILSSFQTSQNTAYLHSDRSLMPRRRAAWSSWNYITASSPTSNNIDQVCLTYNMNLLQHLPTSKYGDILVTLNPLHNPRPETVQGTWIYRHPLYNESAVAAQKQLPLIQNTRGISYCGAWTKYGFHEDGFTSGLQVAVEHLGGSVPWEGGVIDSTYSRGRVPSRSLLDHFARGVIGYINFWIQLVDKIFGVLWAIFRWMVGMESNASWKARSSKTE